MKGKLCATVLGAIVFTKGYEEPDLEARLGGKILSRVVRVLRRQNQELPD